MLVTEDFILVDIDGGDRCSGCDSKEKKEEWEVEITKRMKKREKEIYC